MAPDNVTDPQESDCGSIKINGAALDFALRAAGISRNQLAAIVGKTPGHISRVIRGESRASGETMAAILGAFGDRLTFGELRATDDSD